MFSYRETLAPSQNGLSFRNSENEFLLTKRIGEVGTSLSSELKSTRQNKLMMRPNFLLVRTWVGLKTKCIYTWFRRKKPIMRQSRGLQMHQNPRNGAKDRSGKSCALISNFHETGCHSFFKTHEWLTVSSKSRKWREFCFFRSIHFREMSRTGWRKKKKQEKLSGKIGFRSSMHHVYYVYMIFPVLVPYGKYL